MVGARRAHCDYLSGQLVEFSRKSSIISILVVVMMCPVPGSTASSPTDRCSDGQRCLLDRAEVITVADHDQHWRR